jgi:hypothetical protein
MNAIPNLRSFQNYCIDRIKKNTILVNNLTRKSSENIDDKNTSRSAFSRVSSGFKGSTPHFLKSPNGMITTPITYFSPFTNLTRSMTENFSE